MFSIANEVLKSKAVKILDFSRYVVLAYSNQKYFLLYLEAIPGVSEKLTYRQIPAFYTNILSGE